MRHKLILITLSLLFCYTIADAQEQNEKKQLMAQQMVSTLPSGIINSTPMPVRWVDNENIYFVENSSAGRKNLLYNTKKGEFADYTPPAPRVNTGGIKINNADNPTYSPDSSMIAFTRNNDLYIYVVKTGKEKRLTFDGSDLILNGWASWVYYEEILGRGSRYKAFWWSPDSRKLAYYKFDNSGVPMFPIYEASGHHGTLSETRYPKAGDKNPEVKVGIIDITSDKMESVWADFDQKEDQYFGIPYWSGNSELFIVPWMPRDQNEMTIYKIEPATGVKTSIYQEKQATWIDWVDVASFTDKGLYMVRDFEMWEQIYYLAYDGSKYERITSGNNWGIRIIDVDEKGGNIYFTARREISSRNDFYRVNIKSKKIDRLSVGEYNYASVLLSPDRKNFIAQYSNATTPTRVSLFSTSRNANEKLIADSKGPDFDKYLLALPEMLYMTKDGFTFPASVIWPVNLDPNKKYPVLVNMYGGPGSTQVMDTWRMSTRNQWWAYEGVIQITIDHRASGHCGKEGVNQIFRNLGEVELNDYIAWIEQLREKPFVNRDKVGITGFSYGGTMTVLALTDGNEYFKYGIAGGGVYDWSLYDTHYTERYMDTPQDNPKGYANSRVTDKAKKYIGNDSSMLRITHGTSDDNVHFQNTLQMIDALQKEGKIFELMIYPGQFHGYRGYHSTHSAKEDLIFWYKYLLNSVPPAVLF